MSKRLDAGTFLSTSLQNLDVGGGSVGHDDDLYNSGLDVFLVDLDNGVSFKVSMYDVQEWMHMSDTKAAAAVRKRYNEHAMVKI